LQSCAEGSGIAAERAESLYLTGVSFYEQDQYEKTLSTLRKVIAKFPNSEFVDDALFMMGDVAMEEEDYTTAISYYQKLLRDSGFNRETQKGEAPIKFAGTISPLAPDSQYKIAECYRKMSDGTKSDRDRVLAEYAKCAERFPQDYHSMRARFKIGNIYYQMKDYPRALEFYMKILRDQGGGGEFLDLILMNVGKCRVMTKDYKGAALMFNSVINDHPESEHVETAQRILNYISKMLKSRQDQ
jgi:TolA-binding protein